jgi:hypothetical protein
VAAACNKCLNASACTESETCARDPDCYARLYCGRSCFTLDCRQACAAHDAGASDFSNFSAAYFGHCATDCDSGNDWRCVGHASWPTAKDSSTVISMQTGWYGGGAVPFPLAGITMKICDPQNPSKCNPFDQATTDAYGAATLTLPQDPGLPATPSYFEYSAPNIVTELIYQGFAFSEKVARFGGIAVLDVPGLDALAAQAGVTIDPSRGVLSMSTADCDGVPAPGVTFTATGIDEKSTLVYYANGEFTAQAHETDDHGQGVYLNVPQGTVTVTAFPKSLQGKPSGQVTVSVRAGACTFAFADPQAP